MLRRMHYCMEIYTLGTIGHGHMYYMYSTSRQPKALTMGSALLTWTLVLPVLFFIKFFESAACILTNQTSMQISRNELLRKVLTMMVFLGGFTKKGNEEDPHEWRLLPACRPPRRRHVFTRSYSLESPWCSHMGSPCPL